MKCTKLWLAVRALKSFPLFGASTASLGLSRFFWRANRAYGQHRGALDPTRRRTESFSIRALGGSCRSFWIRLHIARPRATLLPSSAVLCCPHAERSQGAAQQGGKSSAKQQSKTWYRRVGVGDS